MIVDTPQINEGQHYLYVVSVPSGAVKIGITNDIEKRLRALTNFNHEELSLVALLICPSIEDATTLERALHLKYVEQRIHHEWFRVSGDQIIGDLQFAELCLTTKPTFHFFDNDDENVKALSKTYRVNIPERSGRSDQIVANAQEVEGGYLALCPECGKKIIHNNILSLKRAVSAHLKIHKESI